MADSKLQFDLLARDRASGEFGRVGDAARRLEGDLARSGRRGGDRFADGIRSGLDNAKSSLAGAAAGLGGALAAGVSENFQAALDFSGVEGNLGAQLNLDPAQMEEAGRAAGRIYAQGYGESLDQVKAAAVAVAQSLAVAVDDEQFRPLTQQATAFAQIFGQDVTESVRAVGQLMRTDLVDSADEGFDVLTRLFQESGAMSDDLLDTLTEYPIQFKSLGLSAEEAAGLLIQGLEGGAQNSDKVADALKELRIRVTDLTAEEGLEALGLDAQQMANAFAEGGPVAREALDQILTRLREVEDPAEQARLAVELFGTQGEDMATAINAMDLSTARDEIGSVAGATSAAATSMKNTAETDFERFKRSLTMAFTDPAEAWRNLTTTEIPGHAMAATSSLSSWTSDVSELMRRNSAEFRGVEKQVESMIEELFGIPRRVSTSVHADTSNFWERVHAIQRARLAATIMLRAVTNFGIPGYAEGGRVSKGQVALVGEDGPEIVRFDGAGEVIPHDDSMRMLRAAAASPTPVLAPTASSGGGGGAVVEVHADGDEAFLRWLRKAIRVRGGHVQSVLGG